MAQLDLVIHGMDCAEEVATLKAELGPLPGVQELAFDVLNARMNVTYDPQNIEPSRIIEAVARTGMRGEPFDDASGNLTESSAWQQWGRTIMTAASGLFVVAGFATHALMVGWRAAMTEQDAAPVPWAARMLYVMAVVAGGWYVAPKAWLAARRLRPDMNLLMVVAVAGAIGIGEYFEAGTVAFLFSLSLSLEAWSVGRARRAVAALVALTPPQARVIDAQHNETLMDVTDVAVGTRIVIKPGERVPLDGRIVEGQTNVNQAPITGESMPVAKDVGGQIFAGSINEDGAIVVETVKPASESTVAKIIKLVREAQSRRSDSEKWVETFARYYTPLVMLLAIIVAIVPSLVVGHWSAWFYSALVLLVIACPCALVISTPVSIVAALASAARNGILIKGGTFVEMPSRVRALAMDKTGTLTEGRPRVTRIVALAGHNEAQVLEIAAAVEMRSEHPLARAIVDHAGKQNIRPPAVEGFTAVKGKGATATRNGTSVWVGSHRYLEERGQEKPEMHRILEELAAAGTSVIVVGEGDHVCGFIALADQLRPEVAKHIAAIKRAGVKHVVMLTGDNKATAEAISRQAGVDEFRAELLPEDKVKAIEDLSKQFGIVAMVGDGVNDAPALARADIGIAMGAAGTDAAIETADIALMTDDLSRLRWLIEHSHRAVRIIKQNIIAALGVKAVFVVLTFAGHASLWAAIAADTGMSLVVVFNALRLLGGHAKPLQKNPSDG